jgi:hypothetical protein
VTDLIYRLKAEVISLGPVRPSYHRNDKASTSKQAGQAEPNSEILQSTDSTDTTDLPKSNVPAN